MMDEADETERLYPDLDEANGDPANGHAAGATQSDMQESSRKSSKNKSLILTYVFWLFGGWFGLHHFYLGRDRHAFTTWMTIGLYFGIGWFRELWRIPEYVREANEEMDDLDHAQAAPPVSWARSCGSIVVADILGYLIIGAIPNEYVSEFPYKTIIVALTAPAACAIGVHLVGNIGQHEGGIKYPLIAAYATAPIYLTIGINSIFWSSVAANWAFGKYERKWRRKRRQEKAIWKRILILMICGLIYASLWGSWFYFNCTIDKDGEEISCREAAKNFLTSPLWKDFGFVMRELYIYVSHQGFAGLWQELIASLDPHGEANALKVLMLNESASQDEITSQYRKMIRVWHPDRHKDPQSREFASQRFMEIQQAYETLSTIKSKRMSQSRKGAAFFEKDKTEL